MATLVFFRDWKRNLLRLVIAILFFPLLYSIAEFVGGESDMPIAHFFGVLFLIPSILIFRMFWMTLRLIIPSWGDEQDIEHSLAVNWSEKSQHIGIFILSVFNGLQYINDPKLSAVEHIIGSFVFGSLFLVAYNRIEQFVVSLFFNNHSSESND